ncbi:sulfite exporter TauE/SafE family protein [Candidatus Ventrimonas sp. KK005]|nr:sulfite exporter TauE/SafE family protein [Clostridiaceae bacterium]
MTYIIFFAVSILASVVGAICGVGGGVFMKPALDAVGVLPVNTITFLSTCTVISMTSYNVLSSAINTKKGGSDNLIDWNLTTWLAVGSAIGGVIGKYLYDIIKNSSANQEIVGGYQALALLIAVFLTLIYTLNKNKYKALEVKNPLILILLGFGLGTLSSFVGIGGGPMNLAVLYFFLSMPTKTAAQNSLYMILISQIASLIVTFLKGSVPEALYQDVDPGLWIMLIGMMICGVYGGIIGKKINKKIPTSTVDKLFIILIFVIMGLCVWNIYTKLLLA